MANVRWYEVPAADTFDLKGEYVSGAWYAEGNRIAIASDYVDYGPLVRHEMLHALLHYGGHPRDQFLGSCGDIVTCVSECVVDAGGPPHFFTRAAFVAPTAVAVTTLVIPSPVSVSIDSGYFTVTVEVTNESPHPVRAVAPLAMARVGIRFSGTGGGETLQLSDSTVPFARAGTAGSTRRYVYDVLPVQPDYFDLAPGSYTVGSTFLGQAAPPQSLTVNP